MTGPAGGGGDGRAGPAPDAGAGSHARPGRAVEADAVAEVVRAELGRCVATLTRHLGDIGLAEDAFQDAVEVALARWPRDGVPASPGAWLTTVARRRGIDRLRRAVRGSALLDELAADPTTPVAADPLAGDLVEEVGPVDDDQLRMLFTCCHPSLTVASQVALTLRLMGGLTTAQVARSFLSSEPAMAQRLRRAKQTLRAADVPYEVPQDHELPARRAAVIAVVYLVHTTGADAPPGDVDGAGLRAEALRLARLLARLMPHEEEVVGLLALLVLAAARWPARYGHDGAFVPLAAQDRRRWDAGLVAEGHELVRWCLRRDRPGPYQWQAAIAAVHTDAASHGATDWRQVVALYDQWLSAHPSPVVALNRAVALAEVEGDVAGLAVVEGLAAQLDGYQPLHAVRGELCRRVGDVDGAVADLRRAADLAPNESIAAHLRAVLASLDA